MRRRRGKTPPGDWPLLGKRRRGGIHPEGALSRNEEEEEEAAMNEMNVRRTDEGGVVGAAGEVQEGGNNDVVSGETEGSERAPTVL